MAGARGCAVIAVPLGGHNPGFGPRARRAAGQRQTNAVGSYTDLEKKKLMVFGWHTQDTSGRRAGSGLRIG